MHLWMHIYEEIKKSKRSKVDKLKVHCEDGETCMLMLIVNSYSFRCLLMMTLKMGFYTDDINI
jgi:hypothetical protein